mmetsp:Transcript_28883/g.53065  ORF Transcript_28883/g.53065 Transcript_28883/m.53065 type:complete len:274 (-) Transcript_28883:476-1297(-)
MMNLRLQGADPGSGPRPRIFGLRGLSGDQNLKGVFSVSAGARKSLAAIVGGGGGSSGTGGKGGGPAVPRFAGVEGLNCKARGGAGRREEQGEACERKLEDDGVATSVSYAASSESLASSSCCCRFALLISSLRFAALFKHEYETKKIAIKAQLATKAMMPARAGSIESSGSSFTGVACAVTTSPTMICMMLVVVCVVTAAVVLSLYTTVAEVLTVTDVDCMPANTAASDEASLRALLTMDVKSVVVLAFNFCATRDAVCNMSNSCAPAAKKMV